MSAPLLIVRHVPWEGPHRIVDAFPGRPIETVDVLAGGTLPDPGDVHAAVLMGGPMSVHDTAAHPAIADELRWLRAAADAGVPLLGVCLGAQLIATALGGRVVPGDGLEIGVAPLEVLAPNDPVVGALGDDPPALHWHGEAIVPPPGARVLARTERTAVQAFAVEDRIWGLLFHVEADAALLDAWLAEPVMVADAERALGPDALALLRAQAAALDPERGDRAFCAFAACADGRGVGQRVL